MEFANERHHACRYANRIQVNSSPSTIMTKLQRRNLAKLTLYVHKLPRKYKHFQMRWFASNGGFDGPSDPARAIDVNECGTAACFAGHGPVCGIKPKKQETWLEYVNRTFGTNIGPLSKCGLFHWLFGQYWSNSKVQACKRAAWVLQGHPPHEQIFSWNTKVPKEFRSFKPNWALIRRIAKGVEK